MIERELIVVEVEDLVHDLEFNRTFFFGRSMHRRSKWSVWKKDFQRIGYPVSKNEQIVGHCFHFRLKDLDFGGGFVAANYPEPVRHFSSREACIAASQETAPVETKEAEAVTESLSKSQTALLKHLDGKTWPQAVSGAFSDDAIKGDTALITVLVDETARTKLFEGWFESELLTQDEEGKYVTL